MTSARRAASLLIFVVSATAVVTAQRTWVVDAAGGPGVDYLDIRPAINAAANGDRIEVRGTATYSSFTLTRPLDIEAPQGATVPHFWVDSLATGQSVRIIGFRCLPRPSASTPDNYVGVLNCAGAVFLSDVHVDVLSHDPLPGFIVRDANAVMVQDCTSVGCRGGIQSGGPALHVIRSRVTLVRTTVEGGFGGASASNTVGYGGGTGIDVNASSIYLAGSTAKGGDGGTGMFACGNGGDAVLVSGQSTVTIARSTLRGGTGPCIPALAGAAVNGTARVTTDCTLTGNLVNGAVAIPPLTMLTADAYGLIGSSAIVRIDGTPGTSAVLCFDVGHDHQPLQGFDEPLLLTPSFIPTVAPTLTTTSWSVAVPVPNVSVLRHKDAFWQALALEPPSRITLTPLAVTHIP